MKITRKSKVIWFINGERIDTRKKVQRHTGENLPTRFNFYKYEGARGALLQYFEKRNTGITRHQLDSLVCRLINRNIKLFEVLEHQTVHV